MTQFLRRYDSAIEWLLGSFVMLIPLFLLVTRFMEGRSTLYDIFPPLGLMAFGLMWTHFVMGAIRRYAGTDRSTNPAYLNVSMGLVLSLIILHPGLFWLALYLDGYGLPPQSYMEIYATQLGFLALGTIGLLIFLSYEFKRLFGKKRWWKVIELLQIVGMAAIFIHGLGIGSDVREGWVGGIWIGYGVTLLSAVLYTRFIYKSEEGTDAN